MKIYVACRESGSFIAEVNSFEEGVKLIEEYEEMDKKEGEYTPNFYEIEDEEHRAISEG
jgi:hypothetical protein